MIDAKDSPLGDFADAIYPEIIRRFERFYCFIWHYSVYSDSACGITSQVLRTLYFDNFLLDYPFRLMLPALLILLFLLTFRVES